MLNTIVGSQSASEQAIAVSHRKNIVAGNAKRRQTASHTFAPHTDIPTSIAYDGGITRRTT